MGSRQAQLKNWARQVWPYADRDQLEITPVSGDASFRRYFRASTPAARLIAVDAPPEKENSEPFVTIAKEWSEKGIRVPKVVADDLALGFMLLEDFADQQLLDRLQSEGDAPYLQALETLLGIQMLPAEGLPNYDASVLTREMNLFPEWFLGEMLGITEGWDTLLETTYQQLIDSALTHPHVCVHRDYHSRNLMPLADGGLGVIDFQDALIGPVTYDLVSLLRDSYIEWPESQVAQWVENYRLMLMDVGFSLPDSTGFKKQFDLMGMQRQLKVLGIFSRLYLRDGKSGYLKDIPLTFKYLYRSASSYSEFSDLKEALEELIPVMREHKLLGQYIPSEWLEL
jgi:aminoglycoside/choline kinase family phosphotransferase